MKKQRVLIGHMVIAAGWVDGWPGGRVMEGNGDERTNLFSS
jgi:hypothetical protein